jgi:phosphohistidine phosphatase
VLIRHAKAEADAATDAERPLAERGRLDAAAAGNWLAGLGVAPDLALVSPAVRARQTWDGIATTVPTSETRVEKRIYENSVAELLSLISEIPDEVATLVLVGHNPSMHGLAITLDDGTGDDDARTEIHESYPTCGITVFAVTRSWSQLATGDALLHTFAAPRG